MEYFKFVSERGTIEFSLVSPYKMTSHENLNGAETQSSEIRFINSDGAEYENILYEPDELTIKGFIRGESRHTLPYLRANLFKILNGKDKGILYYTCENEEYFTEVLTLRPSVGTRIQNVLDFTAKFLRLSPLWKKSHLNKTDVYKITKKLKTTFTLPCIFSQRTSAVSVVNNGDTDSPCVIKIKCTLAPVEVGENVITIKNTVTQKKLELNYSPSAGEQIVIDSEKCIVESLKEGNIINRMKTGSEFIYLPPGVNEIEALVSNTNYEITAHIEYYGVMLGV